MGRSTDPRLIKTQNPQAQVQSNSGSESDISSNATSAVKKSKRKRSTSAKIKTSRKRNVSPASTSSEDLCIDRAHRKKSKRASRPYTDVSKTLQDHLSRLTEDDLRVLVHGLRRKYTAHVVEESEDLDDDSEYGDLVEGADEDQAVKLQDLEGDEDDQREIEERA